MNQAMKNGDKVEVLRLLREDTFIDWSANNNFIFKWAILNGAVKVVEELLTRVDPSFGANTPIGLASEHGWVEIVEMLLADPSVDPSADDNYAIGLAAFNNRVEVVKLLLADDRVDPSADDNWAIRKAAELGHTEVVRLLMKDQRVDCIKVLKLAAKNNDIELVKQLVMFLDTPTYNKYVVRAAAITYLDKVRKLFDDDALEVAEKELVRLVKKKRKRDFIE